MSSRHFTLLLRTILSSVTILLLAGCAPCAPLYVYQSPAQMDDGIQVRDLGKNQEATSRYASLMDCIYANKFDQVHSILVFRSGALEFEAYNTGNRYKWDGAYYYGNRIQWHRDSLHIIMSTAKSLTSAVVGTAVGQGYLSLEDPIFKYLPDHQHLANGGKEQITVRHLLSMTSGLQWDEWHGAHGTLANDIDKVHLKYGNASVDYILRQPLVESPGTHFTYSGGNMIVMGEVLRGATGRSIYSFAKEFWFQPLGIDSVYWHQFEDGVYACDGAVYMTPRDMLKWGKVFLDRGIWNGKRIVSEDWIQESTAPQISGNINVPLDDMGSLSYGLSWWLGDFRVNGARIPFYQASGWGGQEVIVVPSMELLVVFTGGNYVVKKHIRKMMERYILW